MCIRDRPTIHEGVTARALERKGIIADRCELNRQIKADNALLRELKAAVRKLAQAVKNTLPAVSYTHLMETVKRSSNNVIEFLQSEGYIRFKADSEASSKALYEAYQRWCEDNAQKPMSANRLSSELAQNERLYNVEATNNVHVGGKRVRGFMGIEVVNPLPY